MSLVTFIASTCFESSSSSSSNDAVIVILSLLVAGKNQDIPLSGLSAQLPERYTFSDRIKQIPTDRSQALIAGFDSGNEQSDKENIAAFFAQQFGHVTTINRTDGLRITFENGDIVHLRPSGNAPELRCYTEADSLQRATTINSQAMEKVRAAIGSNSID